MPLLRLTLWVTLALGLHRLAIRQGSQAPLMEPPLSEIQRHFPEATSLGPPLGTETLGTETLGTETLGPGLPPSQTPVWGVLDKDGQTVAWATMTSPATDSITGYAGPSNVLLLMDDQSRIVAASLLSSLDTREHVDLVRYADQFWQQFVGQGLGDAASPATSPGARVDGVSGATLTSLAIAESIRMRSSGTRTSLRFPAEPTLAEAQRLYASAAQLIPLSQPPGAYEARNAAGESLGQLWRTGPLVDNQVGYQGPTELLLAIDEHQVITQARLRSSFDNQPYVRYTAMEASFWSKFVGQSLQDVARLDFEAEGIEGVSGATMTSMAVAETIRQVAQRHLALLQAAPTSAAELRWNWSVGEIACALTALAVIPWSLSRWRGHAGYRRLWQVTMWVVMVGLSGNLISLALLAPWVRALPSVNFAPGLILLVAVSLLAPALSGRNVYCDHVCPHGIAQQWLARWGAKRRARQSSSRQMRQLPIVDPPGAASRSTGGGLDRTLDRGLKLSAIAILILGVTWLLWRVPEQLTIFEPFDVYAWRVGWSASLIVWLISLLLAARKPMAYCRLACPTGHLLETVRLKRTSWQFHWSDLGWLTAAVGVWLI